MIDLRCVTLVCFENRDHKSAVSLLNGMLKLANFGDVRLVNGHDGYEGFSRAEIDIFKTVRTTHMMYVHLDGFIINPDLWDASWLTKFDYIGAPWSVAHCRQHRQPIDYRVGNGGFSLRTTRLARASYALGGNHPKSDVLLCAYQRPILEGIGFKWATPDEAAKFSTELLCPETKERSFGFHGRINYRSHPTWPVFAKVYG